MLAGQPHPDSDAELTAIAANCTQKRRRRPQGRTRDVEAPRRRRHAEPNRRTFDAIRDRRSTGMELLVALRLSRAWKDCWRKAPKASMSATKLKVKLIRTDGSTGLSDFVRGRMPVRSAIFTFRLVASIRTESYRKPS